MGCISFKSDLKRCDIFKICEGCFLLVAGADVERDTMYNCYGMICDSGDVYSWDHQCAFRTPYCAGESERVLGQCCPVCYNKTTTPPTTIPPTTTPPTTEPPNTTPPGSCVYNGKVFTNGKCNILIVNARRI